jgi:hypothetical protein
MRSVWTAALMVEHGLMSEASLKKVNGASEYFFIFYLYIETRVM